MASLAQGFRGVALRSFPSIAVASGRAGMDDVGPTKEVLATFVSISDILKFLEADIG